MLRHWQHTEFVEQDIYDSFINGTPIVPFQHLPDNLAVFVESVKGSKRLEGIYDPEIKGIRQLKDKSSPNRDLRLYMDAIRTKRITMIAVDGLVGTGKTSTCVESIIEQHLSNIRFPSMCDTRDDIKNIVEHQVYICKPHVNAGGCDEQYGYLPGDIDDKLDPTIGNFIQYFDRFSQYGFDKLRSAGYIKILPLGFIRGLDAKDMTIIADESQNTKELVSLATRKASNARIFFLGDTSPFQIDTIGNDSKRNGLAHLIELLRGAPYFQYIEMKSLQHIVRSTEVKDIIRRLFDKYGENPQEWIV